MASNFERGAGPGLAARPASVELAVGETLWKGVGTWYDPKKSIGEQRWPTWFAIDEGTGRRYTKDTAGARLLKYRVVRAAKLLKLTDYGSYLFVLAELEARATLLVRDQFQLSFSVDREARSVTVRHSTHLKDMLWGRWLCETDLGFEGYYAERIGQFPPEVMLCAPDSALELIESTLFDGPGLSKDSSMVPAIGYGDGIIDTREEIMALKLNESDPAIRPQIQILAERHLRRLQDPSSWNAESNRIIFIGHDAMPPQAVSEDFDRVDPDAPTLLIGYPESEEAHFGTRLQPRDRRYFNQVLAEKELRDTAIESSFSGELLPSEWRMSLKLAYANGDPLSADFASRHQRVFDVVIVMNSEPDMPRVAVWMIAGLLQIAKVGGWILYEMQRASDRTLIEGLFPDAEFPPNAPNFAKIERRV